MNWSTPGLPVHHQLPESTKTHVHCVGDAIQPSYPLLFPSPPALNLSSISVFSNESTLRMRWPKYWSFSFNISPSNEHPGLIFRMDWLDLLVEPLWKTVWVFLWKIKRKAAIWSRNSTPAYFSTEIKNRKIEKIHASLYSLKCYLQ